MIFFGFYVFNRKDILPLIDCLNKKEICKIIKIQFLIIIIIIIIYQIEPRSNYPSWCTGFETFLIYFIIKDLLLIVKCMNIYVLSHDDVKNGSNDIDGFFPDQAFPCESCLILFAFIAGVIKVLKNLTSVIFLCADVKFREPSTIVTVDIGLRTN